MNMIYLFMYTHKYVGPRIGYSSVPYYVLKEKKEILNGFYKVIIDNNTFYTLHFQNGSKSDWKKDRVIKFYKSNKLYRLDIYFADSVSGLSYYSIDNFNCKEKKQ
ncbi:hypothetical protein RCZ15_22260 [Capnocytophaga catalasegens]|uniref:Uncharacterized protein n=1 Tax=Capnocytophaga catalasegens TaxID=1004260 RepID=A0AAV5AV19_9FLAO|nr:hypothetical protein RCZ03_20410 [Capnocytophaga catalasegens]GJM51253.1 hypothetical protein RCZ15_22260 [Capnocytophaga catalasegens]GJM53335.1 hypothetical protein RCZ16_16520 [Capnocytophaga catalasegens]